MYCMYVCKCLCVKHAGILTFAYSHLHMHRQEVNVMCLLSYSILISETGFSPGNIDFACLARLAVL